MQYWLKTLLLTLLLAPAVLLASACSEPKPVPVEVPDDISAVTEGFISALRRGDKAAARKFVSSSAQEIFDDDFTGRDALKPAKNLQPLIFVEEPISLEDSYDNEVRVLYAAEHAGGWQVIDLQLYWLDDEEIQIDDWTLTVDGAAPPEVAVQQLMMKSLPIVMLTIAVFALFALIIIIWIARRRPQIIAPDSGPAKRGVASTRRDEVL